MTSSQRSASGYTITPLTTKVIDSAGKEISVFAVCFPVAKHADLERFQVQLRSESELASFSLGSGVCLGEMTICNVFKTEKEPAHAYLQRIDNLIKEVKHVGTALEEFAFRFSVEKGCEGKTTLTAAWSSHIFHYKNGFRSTYDLHNQRIEEMIASIKTGSERIESRALGGMEMNLPDATIEEKRKKFGVSRWDVHVAKMQAENTPAKEDMIIGMPSELINTEVLKLLGGEDIVSLYQVSKKHQKLVAEQLPTLSRNELLTLSFWAFKQGVNPLTEVCLKQLKDRVLLDSKLFGNKTPMDIAVEFDQIALVERFRRLGLKLSPQHLMNSIKNNNLPMAQYILDIFDTTQLNKEKFKEIVIDALKNKSDNKPLLQILFDILNNTKSMGESRNGLPIDTKDLAQYKLLLSCWLDQRELSQSINSVAGRGYGAPNADDAVRNAYQFILANPNPELTKLFISHLGETQWPAILADDAFGAKDIVWQLKDSFDPRGQEGKYIFVEKWDYSQGHDASELYYVKPNGQLEIIVNYNIAKFKEELSKLTKKPDGSTHSATATFTPKQVFDLIITISKDQNTPIEVHQYMFDQAMKVNDYSMINQILDWMKSKNLPLPVNQIEEIARTVTLNGDAVTLNQMFEHSPKKRVSWAVGYLQMHNNPTPYGQVRTLKPEILDVLISTINTAKVRWMIVIADLMAKLSDENYFPEITKGFLGKINPHPFLEHKTLLLERLEKIKSGMQNDFPAYYSNIIPDLTKALCDFQYANYQKNKADGGYNKNLHEYLGEKSTPETFLENDTIQRKIIELADKNTDNEFKQPSLRA